MIESVPPGDRANTAKEDDQIPLFYLHKVEAMEFVDP